MKGCIISKAGNDRIPYVFGNGVRESFENIVNLIPGTVAAADLDARRQELAEVEVAIGTWGVEPLDAARIADYFPRLRAFFYIAGSVRYFARAFLESGVRVFSAWGAMAIPVAEYTVAQIVLANKGAYLATDRYRGGDYRGAGRLSTERFPGTYGTKIGILGAGMIGSLVLEMLKHFSVDALVYDPFASDEKIASLGARRASLEEIFAECQTISNHIANNEQTVGMLDYRLFSLMKDTAAFINTGRGAQVVEADLARAMREGPDRCALLDVTWPEPCPADHEFRSLPNVYITPHIAGIGPGDVRRMADYMREELRSYQENRQLRSEVSLAMLETMA